MKFNAMDGDIRLRLLELEHSIEQLHDDLVPRPAIFDKYKKVYN